jgi:peroxiredoxin family protein
MRGFKLETSKLIQGENTKLTERMQKKMQSENNKLTEQMHTEKKQHNLNVQISSCRQI